MKASPKQDPVIRDGRFLERSNTGWTIQLRGYRLSWCKGAGGWSICLHRLIQDRLTAKELVP